MQKYICKCGKIFEKSSNADTTGYVLQNFSPQHECYGCPFIVTERNWVTKEIIKRECRATPKITYRSFCHIGTDDNDYTACHLYSLDLVFVRRVLNYVNSLEGAENNTHAIPDEWRAADFGICYHFNARSESEQPYGHNKTDGCYGLGIFPLYFQKNKKGTAARREVMRVFFNEQGFRKGTTEESEKQIVLQRIEIAKENAQGKCEPKKAEVTTMKFDIGAMISNASPAAAGTTAVQEIPVDMLIPYGNHPFTLYTGERLNDMVQSVKNNGILTPILVREKGGKYEILAGHNRTNAAKLAGLTTVPAVVKSNLSDDDADMYVIETNVLQRGFKELKISEQAAVVALRHSKMFDENKIKAIHDELCSIEAGAEVKPDSKLARVGEEYGLSKNTIARLIRVNKLLTADSNFTIAVDTGKMPVRAAVELSYISSKAALAAIFEKYKEGVVIDNIWKDAVKIDMKLAEKLRELFEDFDGTQKAAELAIKGMERSNAKAPRQRTHKLSTDTYCKYFTDEDSDEHINEVISAALEQYFANINNSIDLAVSETMEEFGKELIEKSKDIEKIEPSEEAKAKFEAAINKEYGKEANPEKI